MDSGRMDKEDGSAVLVKPDPGLHGSYTHPLSRMIRRLRLLPPTTIRFSSPQQQQQRASYSDKLFVVRGKWILYIRFNNSLTRSIEILLKIIQVKPLPSPPRMKPWLPGSSASTHRNTKKPPSFPCWILDNGRMVVGRAWL